MGIFDKVALERVKGSNFNLSHKHKTTFNIGELIPTCVIEALPGDDFTINVEHLIRLAPMITPIMHNLEVTTHWFFVPNRLLWSDWEDWITGNTEVSPPTRWITAPVNPTHLGSYLGYREQDILEQSVMPVAAYCLIYDEYYRAQFIETTEKFVPLVAGSNNAAYPNIISAAPFKRSWQHDYFTSALPSPQRSDAVELPILTQDAIPVTINAATGTIPNGDQLLRLNSTGALATSKDVQSDGNGVLSDGVNDVFVDPNGTLEVDFAGVIPDINDLREALALQRWLEKEMRSGTRYTEHLMSFWGVKSLDARLQRPEYIGGSKGSVVISEVLTTAQTTGNPVGNMQGHGISFNAGNKFKFKAFEHGFIMAITSVMPETGYYQGIHRMFTRETRYDYANPMFAMLGEQPILQRELYSTPTDTIATGETVFGYMPIFSDYKYHNNMVSGEFMSTLEYWHMDRKFTSAPTLNTTFLQCTTDGRNFASISGNSQIYALIANNIYAYRKLPKFGIPSIVG